MNAYRVRFAVEARAVCGGLTSERRARLDKAVRVRSACLIDESDAV
ncbi:hypothetical protein ABT330_10715 [Streptomyces sp. NPDC000658]